MAASTETNGKSAKPTPMMAQYLDIKRQHPDALLFYRMGDFYEMFFDDAVAAATALDITLTRRGKHDGADIPMCGVPVHSHEGYLERLIRAGFKVAICEQTEDPASARKRRGKALVARAVVRVVTPGTITEDSLLQARANNHLAALARAGGDLGLAWLDMSTGEFAVAQPKAGDLPALLAQVAPGELLVPEALLEEPFLADHGSALTPLAASRFASTAGERRLCDVYGVASLDAFGAFGRAEIGAAGAVVDYVLLTQKGRLPRLAPPQRQDAQSVMAIDGATRRNLELLQAIAGGRRGSLLGVIDRTATGAGGRLLAARLASPLTDVAEIGRRLDMVQALVDGPALRAELGHALGVCPDIERPLGRLALERGGPRDLAALRDGLACAASLRGLLEDDAGTLTPLPEGLVAAAAALGEHRVLIDRLSRALAADLPLLTRDGNFIASGYTAALDEQRTLRDESRRLIVALQARYRDESGIATLKVRHNNVLGYFIEVGTNHGDALLGDERFAHRQTMASAVRFTSGELAELADKIARAGERVLALELELFDDLCKEVDARAPEIAIAARAIAEIDVAAALAELAVARDYCRPRVDDSLAFGIDKGRHPVVEAILADGDTAAFVANDCELGEHSRLWLLSGPNMAGKSTFLRQNALIAVLAQAGSFVPASAAHIGVVDRLFSRVGASDDLARGRSTFMVEMIETAAILNQAGERALVILDEIGRGTATYDGLSIAWATIEHLHDGNACRGLFATHYHELTNLAARLDRLACHTMRVREWEGEAVFLYEVGPGAADRSYGIHVARLAGLPGSVVARASEVLALLESDESRSAAARLADDLPLFAASRPIAAEPPSPVLEALADIELDELSPRQALELLYRLKSLADGED